MTAAPSRAERRRQRREDAKVTKTIDGVSRRLLEQVRDELESLNSDDRVTPEVSFAALLDDWHTAEHSLESIRLSYQRVLKLKKQGRNLETDPVIKRYAETKQEQQAIEEQMVDLLDGVDDDDKIMGVVNERHLAATRGFIWSVPDRLKKYLLEELGLSGTDGTGVDSGKDGNKAREVLGSADVSHDNGARVAQPAGVQRQG